ncbi:alpha-amylase [Streptomyces sp. NPDC006314]|uniref:alpha-amylase n=1 Tax=Streptomyces sp. NPDC006314 TaxID=3154475 RepID=UPI0033BBF32C
MAAVCSLAAALSPFAAAGPVSAAPLTSEPAPACVALYESWRYTNVANDCSDTVSVMVVYQDGATGLCHTVPPGAFTTVGEGYLGQHGHTDHLAVCRPS